MAIIGAFKHTRNSRRVLLKTNIHFKKQVICQVQIVEFTYFPFYLQFQKIKLL